MQPFVHFSSSVYRLCCIIWKFSCLLHFRKYFVEACSFSVYNLFQYSIKFFICEPTLFDIYLPIDHFWISLSVIWRRFPSRYLKCSFHFCILSSWLAAYSFALRILFFLLTSLSASHAIYFNFSFVLVTSQWAFLSFCTLTFVRFLLLSKYTFLSYLIFS